MAAIPTTALSQQLGIVIPQSEIYPTPETLTRLQPEIVPIQFLLNRQVLWERNIPAKFINIAKKMLSFCSLPVGWDSRQAKTVDFQCVLTALTLISEAFTSEIPIPSVVPTINGSVQLEWHLPTCTLEIEILNPISVNLYFEEDSGLEIEQECNLRDSFLEVLSYIQRLI